MKFRIPIGLGIKPEPQPTNVVRLYRDEPPIARRPDRYHHYVIRKFGYSEEIPSKVFENGRVYHLAHAKLEQQSYFGLAPEPIEEYDAPPIEFIVSCKYSLERIPNATRR